MLSRRLTCRMAAVSPLIRTQNVRNRSYGRPHDDDDPLGTTPRKHRARPPRRSPRPAAHDVPLEGRRARQRRPRPARGRLRPHPRRAAQAPRRGRGHHVQLEARRAAPRTDVGPGELGGERHRDPLGRRTTLPSSSTRHGTTPSPGRVPGSTPPWPRAGWTRTSTTATTAGTTPACAGCSSTWSRSTAGTPGTPTCCARWSTVRVGEDPPNDWRPVSGSPLTWIRRS